MHVQKFYNFSSKLQTAVCFSFPKPTSYRLLSFLLILVQVAIFDRVKFFYWWRMIANWKLKPIPSWRPSRYTEDGRWEISAGVLFPEHFTSLHFTTKETKTKKTPFFMPQLIKKQLLNYKYVLSDVSISTLSKKASEKTNSSVTARLPLESVDCSVKQIVCSFDVGPTLLPLRKRRYLRGWL